MSELKAWQQVSSEYLVQETWFKLRKDQVMKSNGQVMPAYYVLEYSNWASVFPVTTDGKVILVRQYRYGIEQWSMEVPGGIMDPGETDPMEAAKRELLEETGYSCKEIIQTAVVAPNPATSNNLMYCFLATGCERTHQQEFDEHEELEVLLVGLDELKQMLRENKILQSLHVTVILYALEKLGVIKW
ncbi:MAG: NUDIX hydrolase [Chitinophagaceae bacterium]